MKLWVKTNRLLLLLLVTASTIWLATNLSEQQVLLPNLASGPILAQVPGQIFLSLAPVSYLAWVIGNGVSLPTLLSNRKLPLLNIGMGFASIFTATTIVRFGYFSQTTQWILIQNLLLFIGLQFSLMSFVTIKIASIAPTSWVLFCALYGHDFHAGGLQVWAFTIDQQASQIGWAASVSMFCLGSALHLSTSTSRKFKLYNLSK
jgi:hypothetical protein